MKSTAKAIWSGSGKEGKGTLSTGSKILDNTPYNFKSRFEDGTDTNPEELIAAAHAGCFNMKLSFVLGNFGYTPTELASVCTINMVDGMIEGSHIELEAKVPDIDLEKFKECVEDALQNCPISALFNVNITLDYSLEQ
jgi:osmotically inducible protein OsmC